MQQKKKSPKNAASDPDRDLYTNVYVVPPTFLNAGSGSSAVSDPFAAPEKKAAKVKPDAQAILESAGIIFGKGASAIYQPAGSQLIVRNTLDQMELVEVYLESILTSVESQVHIAVMFAESDEQALRRTRDRRKPCGAGCEE